MVNSLRSICRRRIDLGVVLVLSSWLKCDSKNTFAAAAFSIVAMDGSHTRGASWRGKTRNCADSCSAVGSQKRGGELSVAWRPLWPRCVVSADKGPPEETREVGAVDWLSGVMLLPGLKRVDGKEGTSDIGVLGDMEVCCSSLGSLK
jgi:hypothetical protein